MPRHRELFRVFFFARSSFNPRPRMGGDRQRGFPMSGLMVSIHAPAWGATVFLLQALPGLLRFNPRPRMGGDERPLLTSSKSFVSIHAPAWGATLRKRLIEGDISVSIHAPAWGATDIEYSHPVACEFQSTPPHGGRQSGQ